MNQPPWGGVVFNCCFPGAVLSFRGLVAQVLSPQRVLTAVFGMGTGGSPAPWAPGNWDPRVPVEPSEKRARGKPRVPCAWCLSWWCALSCAANIGNGSRVCVVGPSPRPMGTASLNMLPCVHVPPHNGVVFPRSYPCGGKSCLGVYFALRCFQRLSRPDIATQRLHLAVQLVHQRSVHPGPLVLGTAPLKLPTPAADRDRTVSRRSEPSSRTALIGEQPNPWDRIQPQDATSRHRGAKPCRRCGRLGKISLLSPG